ncbi:hypothetical protein LLH00_01335 [bacterium]|nr:hypothetical protein [bacterium]
MSSQQSEKAEITRLLCDAISQTVRQYAEQHPGTQLGLEDIREILVKIIDYLDITDITGFSHWK